MVRARPSCIRSRAHRAALLVLKIRKRPLAGQSQPGQQPQEAGTRMPNKRHLWAAPMNRAPDAEHGQKQSSRRCCVSG